MNPDTVRKLLYVFCNGKTMHNDMPFDQFVAFMLDPEDARAILEGLSFSETNRQLPSDRPGHEDEDGASDSENEDEEENSFFKTYQIPEDLVDLVILECPADLVNPGFLVNLEFLERPEVHHQQQQMKY